MATEAGGRQGRERAALLDPEPISILLTLIGTVGAIAIPIARESWWNAPPRVRSRVVQSTGRLSDELRRMEVDLQLLMEVVDAADGSHLPLRLGSQLYLTNDQFRRYRDAAERLMAAAGRSIKRIHEIEASLRPQIFGTDIVQPLGVATETQAQLNGLLANSNVTVREAVRVLRQAMEQARNLIAEIEQTLGGHL